MFLPIAAIFQLQNLSLTTALRHMYKDLNLDAKVPFETGGSNGHRKSDNNSRRMSLKDALMSDEEIIKALMERLPHMKELMDMYCGPDRVTAKQQMQELDRVAKTLPENIPSYVKRFTDRAVFSLQVFFFQLSLVSCKSYNVSFSEMENTEYGKLEYLNRSLSVDLEIKMNVIILQWEQILLP
ncbi:uncharacterized protein LOC109842441 [Asparagus officinalis]|uniref:uncharacterized protein LOC109842441 n=1 Tax=Asparagus officinalis TaxID=4686 RepID=UPI00098E1405|nr:uncharacterized protein LOC109842441 [Asparagus officinalis]